MHQRLILSEQNLLALEWSENIWILPTHPKETLRKHFYT